MVEYLGIAASVIAILSAIFALRKRIFPKTAVASESLTKAEANFDYYFNKWMEAGYSTKHKYLISWDDFMQIDRHQKVFMAKKDENKRLFLLVCAVKNGTWGEWWPEDIPWRRLVGALATLLNGEAGWRPVWRAAYLIEKLVNKNQTELIDLLPDDIIDDKEVKEVIQVITKMSVVKYLEGVTQGNNSHLRDKAFTILEDIKAYHEADLEIKYPDPEYT